MRQRQRGFGEKHQRRHDDMQQEMTSGDQRRKAHDVDTSKQASKQTNIICFFFLFWFGLVLIGTRSPFVLLPVSSSRALAG